MRINHKIPIPKHSIICWFLCWNYCSASEVKWDVILRCIKVNSSAFGNVHLFTLQRNKIWLKHIYNYRRYGLIQDSTKCFYMTDKIEVQWFAYYGVVALYSSVSYRIVSYRIVSYRIVLYLIVLYRIVSYCIVSYRIVSYLIVSYRIVSYRIVSCRIVSYCIVSYRILSYLIVLY